MLDSTQTIPSIQLSVFLFVVMDLKLMLRFVMMVTLKEEMDAHLTALQLKTTLFVWEEVQHLWILAQNAQVDIQTILTTQSVFHLRQVRIWAKYYLF